MNWNGYNFRVSYFRCRNILILLKSDNYYYHGKLFEAYLFLKFTKFAIHYIEFARVSKQWF